METTTAQAVETNKTEEYTLTAAHRCDRCNAQAYYHVILKEEKGELYFCRHDYLKNEDALYPVMDLDKLVNESDRLYENRLKGSVNS